MTRQQSAGAGFAGAPAPIGSANHKDREMNEKKPILVVDDEPSITRLLRLNLE
jgi:hypothetical protein